MATSSRRSRSADFGRWLAAAALAAGGAIAGASPAGAQADPPVIPESYRRASEAVVGLLFPEARRDWTNGDLIWPDGRQQKLSLTGLTWANRDGGYWLASGVEFPDSFDEQVQRLTALKRPTERQVFRVVVAKTDPSFRILEHRAFDPDTESPLCRLVNLSLFAFPASPGGGSDWPRLRVRAASGALLAAGAGLVWWEGEFDLGAMSWSTRGPSAFWRKGSDGTETRDDLALAEGSSPGTVTLLGIRSGESLSFPCKPPCDVSPYAALEAAAAAARREPPKTTRP